MGDMQIYEDEKQEIQTQSLSMENRLEIIEEGIRKKYLARLTEMQIAPVGELLPLEEDLIDNVRLYKVTEMVYPKDESATDKFTTVFNTLSTYNTTVFIILDSDGETTDFYIGVRNNEENEVLKRSTVTLGDTLRNTLVGHFPGAKVANVDRIGIAHLSEKIGRQKNVTSVSVVGSTKNEKEQSNNQFVQGIEKLALSMHEKQYIGIIIAENQTPQTVQCLRSGYQEIYTKLSPLQKVQFSESIAKGSSRSKSFFEMNGKQKAATIGASAISLVGAVGGAALGTGALGTAAIKKVISDSSIGALGGSMLGGQIAGQFNGFITSLAPTEQLTESITKTKSSTADNKAVIDILQMLDEAIKKTKEYDCYGMWNIASYFISNDMSSAEIAASNYRSLMNGEKSGRELSAINSWRSNNPNLNGNFDDLTMYLSRFIHPKFCYGNNVEIPILTDATTSVSGKDLGLHMGLPRATVTGLPVIEHAEFGKEVTTYQLYSKIADLSPEERMTLGKIFDLGKVTNKLVELENKSLNMHTFITGSTGSGKSNTVYQMLCELHQDNIPWLVIEPAKGEYKDVFGNWPDVKVFSTNPMIADLININPFKFPKSIHVLEHVDGLVEIFSVCWPMYDAMPAFFKTAILKSYEKVGWDLGSSTFEKEEVEYPDFDILANELENLIEDTDYSAEVKGNYTGALVTRVKSLTVGLNKYIFTSSQTPYEVIFDHNCILDISRVKSSETKALLMGLIVYMLNEYREEKKEGNNNGLKHITVLEEAHNLLKKSNGTDSELVGKSVEMLTNTIAEVRTYGEGFIIVDQSPSSVDIAAIKNTNTKIVLRTPEANDRDAIGRSVGLNSNQVNEISKLPSGVAVVYQNNWVEPVLVKINKANVEENKFIYNNPKVIKSIRESRSDIIKAIMEPWMPGPKIEFEDLVNSLNGLFVTKEEKKLLSVMICTYNNHNGHILWNEESIGVLKGLLLDILDISQKTITEIKNNGNSDMLRNLVNSRLKNMTDEQVEEICYIITRGD